MGRTPGNDNEEMSMDETRPVAEKTITFTAHNTVTIDDLGNGIFQVNGAMVASAPKMLAAVSAALHLEPKPRAPRSKEAKPKK